jgi:protein SYS1
MPRRKTPRAGSLTDLPPLKIIRSILILQLSYYVIATVIVLFTTLVAGQTFGVGLVFDWRTVRGDNTVGWLLGGSWLGVAFFEYVHLRLSPALFSGLGKRGTVLRVLLGLVLTFLLCRVIVLLLLISRSKLVPDFALTLHFLHLLTTSVYTKSLPANLLWWALQAGSAGVMISLGVWACRYRELRPISFGTGSAANAGSGTRIEEGSQGESKTEEHIRGGRGRGRNRDEGPSYEMVAVKEENGEAV